ncbi:MAG TPA: hypothetical protein VF870_11475 [Ignavibacteriaceae bacterium]|jgi:hypothetical protein
MNNSENVKNNPGDEQVFEKELLFRIIQIQDLPEEVVTKFLKAAGSLSSTDFGKKYSDDLR